MTGASSGEIRHPFGHYGLPRPLEALRRTATGLPANRLGRLGISAIRAMCLAAGPDPFDVTVAAGVSARLYPRSNRCEKRVFTKPELFDPIERKALVSHLDAARTDRPFVFMDVGANVGLYSLFLAAHAATTGREYRIVAVEPDAENRRRLEANTALSNLKALSIDPVAVSGTPGSAALSPAGRNRGEVRLEEAPVQADNVAHTETIPVETLPNLIKRHNLSHVDALKIDIEGHDLAALETLFRDASPDVWPTMLVAEVGRVGYPNPISGLCQANGYQIRDRARLNVVLVRDAENR